MLKRSLSGRLPVIFFMCAAMVYAGGVSAQEPDVPINRQQADRILEELKGIRQLLEKIEQQGVAQAPARPARPKTATLTLEPGRPTLGADTAPVIVVEYTDYQCPFCRRFTQSTFPLLKRDYIDTGKVRWQVRDLPLGFHKDARKAAQAALCAGEQERFWVMRDHLFRHSANLAVEQLKAYAVDAGLDSAVFAACLDSDRHLARIDSDASTANQLRITGTPTFVVGTEHDGKLSGNVIVGAQTPAVFAAEIKRLLEQ